MGLPFSCVPSPVDENFDPHSEVETVVKELAIRKVKKVMEITEDEQPLWVFGADTLIALNGVIYGKPLDREDARRMLKAFEGREHRVITAIALYSGRKKTIDCRSLVSTVTFAALSDGEIEWYLNSEEWKDAAGSYKIQGLAACFISSINGSYSSIVGLPLREFYTILRDNGYPYGA